MWIWCCRPVEPDQTLICATVEGDDTFVVLVDKGSPDAPLGIRLDLTGKGAAYVCSVMADSAVAKHNQCEPPHRHVLQGYYIAKVGPYGSRPQEDFPQPIKDRDARASSRRARRKGRSGGSDSDGEDRSGGGRAMRYLLRSGGRQKGKDDSESDCEDEPRKKLGTRRGSSLRKLFLGRDQPISGYDSDTDEEGLSGRSGNVEGFSGGQWVAGSKGCNARLLLKKIHDSAILRLEVRKPKVWTCIIDKKTADEFLGLEIKYAQEGGGLVVDRVVAGPVERWNQVEEDQAIERNDRIISVNGTGHDPQKLVDSLNAPTKVVILEVSRPAEDPTILSMPA